MKDIGVPEAGPLEVLAKTPVGVATPHEIEMERARIVPWLAARIERLPELRALQVRERTRKRTLAGALAVAAALPLMAWGASSIVRSNSELSSARTSNRDLAGGPEPTSHVASALLLSGSLDSGSVEALPGSRFGLEKGLRTRAVEGAALRADEGYEMRLAPSTSVALVAPAATENLTTTLRLTEGRVELSVPKLAPGRKLEVLTEDARVTVWGTEFSVQMRPSSAIRTCVRVTGGRVEVAPSGQPARMLTAGGSFGCEESTPTLAVPERARTAMPSGDLAEENRLLARALSAEKRGEREAAVRAYRELLRRFPHSRFLPEAQSGLERALRAK